MKTFKLITDAAVKNVGEAIRYRGTAGMLILDQEDNIVKYDSFTLGKVTNNEGEFEAVSRAIQFINNKITTDVMAYNAKHLDAANTPGSPSVAGTKQNCILELYTDSDLLYNQLLGNYKVKEPRLQAKIDDIKKHAKGFKHVKVNWHKRDQPLAVLADFASKHTAKTKKLDVKLAKCSIDTLIEHVDFYVKRTEELKAAKAAKEAKGENNE